VLKGKSLTVRLSAKGISTIVHFCERELDFLLFLGCALCLHHNNLLSLKHKKFDDYADYTGKSW